jgi:hypothetical protein
LLEVGRYGFKAEVAWSSGKEPAHQAPGGRTRPRSAGVRPNRRACGRDAARTDSEAAAGRRDMRGRQEPARLDVPASGRICRMRMRAVPVERRRLFAIKKAPLVGSLL